MANPKINISKTTTNGFQDNPNDAVQEKVDAIVKVFNLLLEDPDSFDEKIAFNALHKYIEKYERILYSPLSNIIYNVNNNKDSEVIMGNISTNMDKLVAYTVSSEFTTRRNQTKKPESIKLLQDTKKAILKIWDHINLAQQQYSVLKQSDEEYQQKFNGLISSYKEDMTKDMSNQLLTMVSIFTALAFLVFGGISSLDNIFSAHGIPMLKLMCIGTVWGLCILNLIFVFLFCVGKMTKLNFKSTDDPNVSIFQKYLVVWWTDLILVALLIICLWAYYIRKQGIDSWISGIYSGNPMWFMIGGTILILLIIIVACVWLTKKTKK